MTMKPYVKAIVAAAGAVLTTALTIWGPETDVGRVLIIASAAFTAVSVYAFPNEQVPPAAVAGLRERLTKDGS